MARRRAVLLGAAAVTSAPITLPCDCPLGETGFKLYKYVDFGAHAGGPLITDRVWYFGGVSNAGPSARFPGAADTPEEHRWTRDEYRSNHKITWAPLKSRYWTPPGHTSSRCSRLRPS